MSVSVEAIIRAAVERGELDNLPYKGQRLPLDDDSGTHPEDRLSHRILKNAGMTPPEVSTMKEIDRLRAVLAETDDVAVRRQVGTKIAYMESELRIRMERNARR